MARPQKKGVDYFPHDVTHGKTLFVLEQRWGNDGYAVWFKLLEALGAEPQHYLDLRDEATELHLAAKCRISPKELRDILGALATLGAISTELWRVSSVVWCQNLVDRVSDAYRLRKGKLPKAPKHLITTEEKRVSTEETPVSSVSTEEMPQREREREREIKPIRGGSAITEEVERFKKLHLNTCGLNTLPPLPIIREILLSGKPPSVIDDVYQLCGGDTQKYRQKNIVERLTDIRDGKETGSGGNQRRNGKTGATEQTGEDSGRFGDYEKDREKFRVDVG